MIGLVDPLSSFLCSALLLLLQETLVTTALSPTFSELVMKVCVIALERMELGVKGLN